MKTFTIENETNNITVHASAQEAESVRNSDHFGSEAAFAKLAAKWSTNRLAEIWNTLPGATPIKQFRDRKTAVSRIWKAIQTLGDAAPAADQREAVAEPETAPLVAEGPATEVPAPVAPQAPDAAPVEVPANNEASPVNDAPAAATDEKLLRVLARAFDGLSPEQREVRWLDLKEALDAPKRRDAPKVAKSGAAREGSKTSQVISMLKREGGTTLEEIMSTMAWQKHTTRAMLSAGGSLVKKHGLQILSEKVGDKRVYSIKA